MSQTQVLSDLSDAMIDYTEMEIHHQFGNEAPLMYLLLPKVTNQGWKGKSWKQVQHTAGNTSVTGQAENADYGPASHEEYAGATWNYGRVYGHYDASADSIEEGQAGNQYAAGEMLQEQLNGLYDEMIKQEHRCLIRGDGSGALATVNYDAAASATDLYVDDNRFIADGQWVRLYEKVTGTARNVGGTGANLVQISTVAEAWTTDQGYKVVLATAIDAAIDADVDYVGICAVNGFAQDYHGLLSIVDDANPAEVNAVAQHIGGIDRDLTTRQANLWDAQIEDGGSTTLSYPQWRKLIRRCQTKGGGKINLCVTTPEIWDMIGFSELADTFKRPRKTLGPNFEAIQFFGTDVVWDDLLNDGDPTETDGTILCLNTKRLAYPWKRARATGLPVRMQSRELAPNTSQPNRRVRKVTFHFVAYGGGGDARLAVSQVGHRYKSTMFGWRTLVINRPNNCGKLENVKQS